MFARRPPALRKGGHMRRWCALLCLAATSFASLARAQAGNSPRLLTPSAIAYDATGDLYIADKNRNQVVEATLAGALVVVAGTGTQGFSGDGGAASSAELNNPQGLAFGADGTLYIADSGNARIRAVSGGTITTFAGSGRSAYGGDGSAAIAASFRLPTALALDGSGALLVCDTADQRVRRVSNGLVTTFAGDGLQGFAGDGGPAISAQLDSPSGLAIAPDGRVFLADTHNNRLRVVTTDGRIATFAGTGQRGFAGDGGYPTQAQLASPRGLAITSTGTLLVADADDERVRSIDPSGVIATIAGNGFEGATADGGNSTQASLHAPRAVAVSVFGQPVLADSLNGTVRVLVGGGQLYQPAALDAGRTTDVQTAWASSQPYGQAGASVTVVGNAGTALGTVTLNEGGAAIGAASLSTGAATLDLPSLNAGTHTLTVTYAGDGLNPAAAAEAAFLTVTPLPVTATASAVAMEYGATMPTISGTLSGVLAQDAGQVGVSFSPASPVNTVGSYPLQATLTGARSGEYVVSVAPASGSLQVTPAGTTTNLGSVGTGYAGVPLQLAAQVTPATGGHPSGTVQFLDGGTLVATGAVVNGSASAAYAAPPVGSRSLTAVYSGDENYQPSSSAAEIALVNSLPDFTIATQGGSSATANAGSLATYNLTIAASPGPFTGIVTMSATGLPTCATITFSPVQVVPGTSSAVVTASVQTPAPQALLRRSSGAGGNGMWVAGGLLLLGGSLRRRRRLTCLFTAAICLCGCGARTVGEGVTGAVSQTYTVQMTGTSTNLAGAVVTHTTPVTLVVNQ